MGLRIVEPDYRFPDKRQWMEYIKHESFITGLKVMHIKAQEIFTK